MDTLKFWDFGIIDIIDVTLVALLLYYVYRLVKGTVAINIFIGIAIIYIVWQVTAFLKMELLSSIFGGFMSVGIIALIVVFQPEIRKFLLLVGSTNLGRRRKFFSQLNFIKNDSHSDTDISAILKACKKMGSSNTGALIVLERGNSLDFLTNTGDKMSIAVSQPIIESIFFKNSPLHDGAIIIEGNTVKATRVILPVNNEKNIPNRFGLRHRAAIGISEKTDAIAIVVSEETGQISYIKNGEFTMYNTLEELETLLKEDLE